MKEQPRFSVETDQDIALQLSNVIRELEQVSDLQIDLAKQRRDAMTLTQTTLRLRDRYEKQLAWTIADDKRDEIVGAIEDCHNALERHCKHLARIEGEMAKIRESERALDLKLQRLENILDIPEAKA